MDPEVRRNFDALMEDHAKLSKQLSFWRSFWRGVISGIGATVGAAVVIAITATILHQLAGIDLFKPAVESILPYIERQAESRLPLETALPDPTYEEIETSPTPESSPESSPTSEEAA